MKKVAVLIRDKEQQYEGLRTSLGLLLESVVLKFFVLDKLVVAIANKESDEEAYEEYFDNMGFIDEMDGERYSNNRENVDKHSFKHVTPEQTVAILKDADIVIPF